MVKWEANKKPDENICPQIFCFFWSEENCKCEVPFGSCMRIEQDKNKDWYEPCEPELKKYGLPWFYFISNSDKLADDFKIAFLTKDFAFHLFLTFLSMITWFII